ncbi:MAG TPA: formate dehydrogenase accessory sulfurtransferase FdhD [Tepidisphaeraceae bacterium]|jgi:FdhD protein|nr:formate dehydrogenase accessory sulfurtransferase FdhD [Tepidisphaeraceae bacterium]
MNEILRYQAGQIPSRQPDELAIEEPLEIRVKGKAVSVTMRTPGHDEELAAGFLLSEGIITSWHDLVDIEPCKHDTLGNIVNVTLDSRLAVDFARLTRHVFASSSCGLCGKATIESILKTIDSIGADAGVDAAALLALPEKLRQAQPAFDRTGGSHAAALFTSAGELLVAREDVGRHNAVDKAVGYALLNQRLPLDRHILLVSGRASFEIMQKSLAARIPIVAAISAPSTLAVEFARESGQTLVGFLRGQRMNVYNGAERIAFTS